MQDTKFELKSRQLRLFEGYCVEDTAEQQDRYRNLARLGVSHQLALNTISYGKGSWRIAASQALQYALTDELLERRGYLFFSSYYKKVVTA